MALSLMALAVVSCAGDGSAATTTVAETTTVPPTATSSVATTTPATTPATTTTTDAPTTSTQQIDVYFEGGQVVGPDRVQQAVGDLVSVWVLFDVDDQVHVHGYDLFFAAKAGVPLEISLTADIPGIFEVELESTHTLLFELEVAP
jgi:hypothetical protein